MQRRETRIKRRWQGELSFTADDRTEDGLQRVSEKGREMGLFLRSLENVDEMTMANLRLVYDEIGSNIVRHARADGLTRLIASLEVDMASVRFSIADNGNEFNPLAQPLPYLGGDLGQRCVGGLGLYFVRAMFPDAVYRRETGWNKMEIITTPQARIDV